MNVTELIKQAQGTAFSFEVLPPIKGTGTDALWHTIDTLREFAPKYINITTHRSEFVYTPVEGGLMQRQQVRRRPGAIAIAAAIHQRTGLPVVPHMVCSDHTREEIEYNLIDLQFLGITDVLLLRGDKAKDEAIFRATPGGHLHAIDLQRQVNRFNQGFFCDGTPIRVPYGQFSYGVACYPEKHDEAPNLTTDLMHLKAKADEGASYAVTQLFYDNQKYFDFVRRAREMGITIPIIPGIKPFAKLSQLTMVPKTFHCDIPEPLADALSSCKTDAEVVQVGVEWGIQQCRELIAYGVPSLHFYTLSATDSVARIAKAIY